MIKAFLSHSSADKDEYVRKVAESLGKENIHYDEWTFEAGEKPLDEILSGLNRTDLFVLFLSQNALKSEWVQREIIEAKTLLTEEKIAKVFPIVIDDITTYKDDKIPDWLKNYNLKPIKRALVASKRIQHKLRELSWSKHPELKKRHSMFVGRNDKQDEFEGRIHDFCRAKPSTIFATGLPGVGRRTFLHRALVKTNVSESIYKPSSIYLDDSVSIEDFILKINDLGLIDLGDNVLYLSEKSIEDKRAIIHSVMYEAYKNKEVIYILDDGCLINYQRSITEWFHDVIITYELSDFPIFAIASKYRVNFHNKPMNDKFFFVELPELNPKERANLLSQLLRLYNVDMSKDDFNSVNNLLFGLPDQIMFAVDIIRSDNRTKLIDKLPILTEYNTDRASILLRKYDNNESALNFIRLLAQFEIISSDFIFKIAEEKEYFPILEELVSESICELIGIDGEIIRLNDVIRDYIKRNKIKLNNDFTDKLDKQVRILIQDDAVFERDSSEYIYSIKEALKRGYDVDPKLLIPSHYLRCMKDLYFSKGSLDKIIELADVILQKNNHLDSRVKNDIRYYLCLALAKKKDSRLLSEVQEIKGDEHNFLLGFYYRLSGRYDDALQRFSPIVNAPYVGSRAKREIVQVYVQLEEYEKALTFAKNNYEENRGNQFHTQAYFHCLINSDNVHANKSTLETLINDLRNIDSEQSVEMADIALSLFEMKVNNDKQRAIDLITDAVYRYPETYYPLLTFCDIAIKYEDKDMLIDGVKKLENISKFKNISSRTLNKYKSFLFAFKGDFLSSIKIIEKELNRYPIDSKERITNRLRDISSKYL
ncbi:TIR domain-containing protein [Providencia manganoxydans]|uniref:TIR domain-containing protein n=1 Tax=Providencia manganoxydans TaxID=2923283 RepID=UPI0034E3B062